MAKFEYTTTPSMGTDLNKMGADGWEMAGNDAATIYWKRALPESDSIHHQTHKSPEAARTQMTSPPAAAADSKEQLSDAQRNAATHTPGKPDEQPADRPIGKNEPSPRPETTARTEGTAKAGSGGTAEATPRGHTPPQNRSGGHDGR